MSITKTIIDGYYKENVLSWKIRDYLNKNPFFKGIIIKDCFNNIHIKEREYIPQLFGNSLVFISSSSFQQNNIVIGQRIRKYILTVLQDIIINIKKINNIQNIFLTCVGGESYFYGLLSNFDSIYHITNNSSIHKDSEFNKEIYKKEKKTVLNNLVDYNDNIYFPDNSFYCVINLSSLNTNLVTVINNHYFKKIVIISCNHKDFWKKIGYLTRYKLVERKKFVDYETGYFITVNTFINKDYYISLGYNCSVAYNLRNLNLRLNSYPFDWSRITSNQLLQVLNNNFKDYNKLEIKKYSEEHPNLTNKKEEGGSLILLNSYGITFAHEVIEQSSLNEFQEKLDKRLTRLKNKIFPTFVRLEKDKINIKRYEEIIIKLSDYFDYFEFILISKDDPKICKIKHIKLDSEYLDWKYSNFDWKKIV